MDFSNDNQTRVRDHDKDQFNPEDYTEDGIFTVEQVNEIYETFTAIDIDGNGTLDYPELITCLTSVGMRMSSVHMEELLKEMDVDGSGDVDFSEFIHILKQRTAISSEEEDLWIAFHNFVRNHSSFIEAEDVKGLLLSLGERVSDADAAEMVKLADLDGDGKVSFEDYSDFIKSL
ncbi:neo-calmodulin-like isoform X2 [Convolutriloba macropyga]|uniref:neo-calmodulin-like isoform X2 n=1 Tax=Convolutriloba macropyga TaxID=536237 RepID=UPI003F51C9A5